MILHLNWGKSLLLKDASADNAIYSLDLSHVPDRAGIYIFGRRHGSTFEALYVGKATKIRGRIRVHFNNLKLMQHLRTAKSGKRILLTGVFERKQAQNVAKSLRIAEQALIRHFLAEGHDLVNKAGTRIRRHEIVSDGNHPKRYFPKSVFAEKGRGE